MGCTAAASPCRKRRRRAAQMPFLSSSQPGFVHSQLLGPRGPPCFAAGAPSLLCCPLSLLALTHALASLLYPALPTSTCNVPVLLHIWCVGRLTCGKGDHVRSRQGCSETAIRTGPHSPALPRPAALLQMGVLAYTQSLAPSILLEGRHSGGLLPGAPKNCGDTYSLCFERPLPGACPPAGGRRLSPPAAGPPPPLNSGQLSGSRASAPAGKMGHWAGHLQPAKCAGGGRGAAAPPRRRPSALPARKRVCTALQSVNRRDPARWPIVSGPAGPAVAGGHAFPARWLRPTLPATLPSLRRTPAVTMAPPKGAEKAPAKSEGCGRPVAAGARRCTAGVQLQQCQRVAGSAAGPRRRPQLELIVKAAREQPRLSSRPLPHAPARRDGQEGGREAQPRGPQADFQGAQGAGG